MKFASFLEMARLQKRSIVSGSAFLLTATMVVVSAEKLKPVGLAPTSPGRNFRAGIAVSFRRSEIAASALYWKHIVTESVDLLHLDQHCGVTRELSGSEPALMHASSNRTSGESGSHLYE